MLVKSKVIKCDNLSLLNAKITDLTENKINREPTTFIEFLENAKGKINSNFTVKIANENIREVCENSFEHVSGINVLNLTSNGINTLKPGCFSGIIALEVLNLSDNELQEIKNGVFNDFEHLKELVLSNNAIAEIGSRAFGNLPSLQRISLDHNNIVILGRDWFQHSPNLRWIDLSNNRITAVGPRILQTIRPTMCAFDYQNDDLIPSSDKFNKDCEPGQKINLTASGMNINLSNNEIISVHPAAFNGLTFVDFLDLRYNNLISFRWQDMTTMFNGIDLRNNLPNLKLQEFPLNKIIIERNE